MRNARLLERGAELAAIGRYLDQAVAGQGCAVLIEGPAGIGKSRLLQEARDLAAGRMTVLTARCSELERDFPFGAVRQLFEGIARGAAGDDARERLFDGAAEPARQRGGRDRPRRHRRRGIVRRAAWAVLGDAEPRRAAPRPARHRRPAVE